MNGETNQQQQNSHNEKRKTIRQTKEVLTLCTPFMKSFIDLTIRMLDTFYKRLFKNEIICFVEFNKNIPDVYFRFF